VPTYEYFCEIKHDTFEVQQSIKDEPLTICPHCKEEGIESPVKKMISSTSFVLHGGGWASSGYNK
jgi:putative FmdB family regulatory protein